MKLTLVKDLLSNHSKWCKYTSARNYKNKMTSAKSPDAVKWCVTGACVLFDVPDKEYDYLIAAAKMAYPNYLKSYMAKWIYGCDWPSFINDECGYDMVMKMIDIAIGLYNLDKDLEENKDKFDWMKER